MEAATDQMVDVTIDGDWFASVRVATGETDFAAGANAFVAQAQAELAARGYILDNEVTYVVRAPAAGEKTRFAREA